MTNSAPSLRIARGLPLLALLVVLIPLAWLGPLDAAATRTVDDGLKRALISFAAARGLNAAISVVQGTEVSAAPAGMGVIFTPGQVLDPINDLVEQFSSLMLAASVAFGTQKVLIAIGAHPAVSLLLLAAAFAWAFRRWRGRTPPLWLSRLTLMLFLVRFAVPAVAVGSELLFEGFMAEEYHASRQVIETAADPLKMLAERPDSTRKDDAWWPGLADVKERIQAAVERAQQVAERTAEHIVRLIVIFMMQTLVVPLALSWVLYRVGRAVFEFGRPG
jgi:hypothetical protein